jgi:methyl-accepting chemotaxis protein
MDEMTQQNSVLVEEAATAARTLQQQALTLSRAVAAFRLDEAVQPPPAAPHAEQDAGGERRGRAGQACAERPYLRLASSRD